MSNKRMILPTASDSSETLRTASSLLVYSILKVTTHSIVYFLRNSILNFQRFQKFQNRTFLKFIPSERISITLLTNVQSV